MSDEFRLLFVGDIVGTPGVAAAQRFVPELRRELQLDAVIINAENSAENGFGVTEQTATALLALADVVTLGDHAFDQEGIGPYLDREPRIIRPANFADPEPGHGWGVFAIGAMRVGVVNLLGQRFMRPRADSLFGVAEQAVRSLREAGAECIVVDVQAEDVSEKQALGWTLAGRVTAVLGTHTHVPTADLQILPVGTAYVTDVGMTGGRDSILGFERKDLLHAMVTGERPSPPRPAAGPVKLDAVLIRIDCGSGEATGAGRVYREAS